jgi:hypothetical protein
MSGIDPLTVKTLIADRGQTLTFRRTVEGSYDPSAGQTSSGSTDDETVKGVFVNYHERQIGTQDIERGDRQLLLSAYQSDGTALSKTPQTQDLIIGEDNTVNIVDVQTLRDADQVIAYVCQVRE